MNRDTYQQMVRY